MAVWPAAGREHAYPQPRLASTQHWAGDGVCCSSCCGSIERGAALSLSAGQAQAPACNSSIRQLMLLQPPRGTGNKPQDSTYSRRRQCPAWVGVGPWLDKRKD